MKANNRYQRLKRIAARALVMGMLVCVGVFMTDCKKDVCDKDCKMTNFIAFWLTMGPGLDDSVPCSHNYDLSPGDSVVISATSYSGYISKKFRGCSDAPWILTAIPSADIIVEIIKSGSPYCSGGLLLSESSIPGDAISISGPAGCISEGTDVIEINGSGAAGTITVEFN